VSLKLRAVVAILALAATSTLASCGGAAETTGLTDGGTTKCVSGSVTGQGSTAQAAAMARWIGEHRSTCPGATITYQANGSGAGQQAFIAGSVDFAGSDSPLAIPEQAKANARCGSGQAIHLPILIGPVAVVYNLGGTHNLQLKPATLARIFDGSITRWNADQIRADNPGVALPERPIVTVHRADSSGTTDNFTGFLAVTAPEHWRYGASKVWQAPGGIGKDGGKGIGDEVSVNAGTISYVEWSVAQTARLDMAKIYNGSGQYATLTGESAGTTIDGSDVVGSFDDLKLKVNYFSTLPGAYPIVQVTYEIVCNRGHPADKLALLKSFLAYVASSKGQAAAGELGYAPLPPKLRKQVTSALDVLA
jgi:phosphate transport system substrate-binding protein